MKNILLWCSPGFGLVDVWLPVIKKLKEQGDIKIDFVFPEPSTLRLEDKSSDLFKLAEKFSDRIIYRSYSRRWFIATTLAEAKLGIKFRKVDEKIFRLARRLSKGKLSNYIFFRFFGSLISSIVKYTLSLRENFSKCTLYDICLLRQVDGILCDITVEDKVANIELRKYFKNIKKFSMMHGLDPCWVQPDFNCKKSVNQRPDIIIYSISTLANNGYKKCFGALDGNIVHAGIPRHDDDWIKFVSDENSFTESRNFVLLIGRAASPFNPVDRKEKALRDIYNVICIKNKLKLIVKLHPKENLNGFDGDIYRRVLGLNNYGKTWEFSDRHPLILGQDALFSISFYSGVVLDMLALDKPTIEYLDLRDLKSYKGNDILIDKHGNKTFQYRFVELVLGVDSNLALEKAVESVINHYDKTLSPLKSKYINYFNPFNNSSKKIADDILSRANKMEQ